MPDEVAHSAYQGSRHSPENVGLRCANPTYNYVVIPAKAGIQTPSQYSQYTIYYVVIPAKAGTCRHTAVGEFGQPKTPWIPAFAGMTG
ncbi:MAG: hypothetical protein L0H75_08740 [Nitrosospira sp.]|nr:hypothetical protein [Nitrosospira sp.]